MTHTVPPKLKKINKRTQKFANPGEDDTISYEALFGAANASKFDKSKAGTAPSVDEATLKKPPAIAPPPPLHEPSVAATDDDDELMIVDPAEVTLGPPNTGLGPPGTGRESSDEQSEPDTEDDEAPASLPSATPAAISAKLAEAHELVKKSFSWGSYGAAQEAILAARRAAEQVRRRVSRPPRVRPLMRMSVPQLGETTTYNAGLRDMVEALRVDAKKRDFLGRMKEAGLTLLINSSTTAADAQNFLASLP